MLAPHNLELMLFKPRFHKSMYNVYFTRFEVDTNIKLNPLTLTAAKRGLTILVIFNSQTHFLENV